MALADFLGQIATEGDRPKYSELLQLSGLTSDELFEFKVAWASVGDDRRRLVIGQLVELCEDNLELDFSAVFRASLEDSDDEVRENAARGLWETDDRTNIRPLIALLKSDPTPRVRAAAAMSLGRFASLAQEGKLLSRDADRVLDALLGAINGADVDIDVKRRAIESVAFYDIPKTEEIIREAHRSEDQALRQSSIYAMGQTSNLQWLSTLHTEISNESPAIRYEAVGAAGNLGDESTVPYLIEAVQDEDHQVQLAAVKALGTVGGPLAKRALERCKTIGDESLEQAADAALESMEFDEDPLGFSFNNS